MESQLIQRSIEGDAAAFDMLIQQHRDIMFRYAYLILRDAHDAEDVVQDTVLKIYRSLKRFDQARPFRPWALQITRNNARNRARSIGRYKHFISRFIQQRETHSVSVETLSARQMKAQTLHQAVQELSSDQQDVIYARYFLELSTDETAEILEIASGTVKSRLSRALQQLKGIIQQGYPELHEELQS